MRVSGALMLGLAALIGGAAAAGPGAALPEAAGRAAYSRPDPDLDPVRGLDFRLGEAIFAKLWASAPSSTRSSDGLGPLYNARACLSCHPGHGRAALPEAGAPGLGLVLRLDADPVYGHQLQTQAVQGQTAEGRLGLTYDDVAVALADGTAVSLRRPRYTIEAPAYGPPRPGLGRSPRQAPALIGLGRLAAIPGAAILAQADPDDRDGDGISGRPNLLPVPGGGAPRLGRFGWKAGQATIADQVAAAFAADLGLSTPPLHRSHGDCTAAQTACLGAATGDDPRERVEVGAGLFDLVVLHVANLALSPTAPAPPEGARLFGGLGCAACHRPEFETPLGPVRPFTDLLLHDMGPGLADTMADGAAGAREWRTAPLWGLGAAQGVGGSVGFLHDGRARTLLEAVLWHGGEAAAARDRVVALDAGDRAALIAYLNAL